MKTEEQRSKKEEQRKKTEEQRSKEEEQRKKNEELRGGWPSSQPKRKSREDLLELTKTNEGW